eukprot:TRINITY_DN3891_c0_g1_i1.p1 TRINITY_DN3891_c0_g1~~TRINITY_DN3891_c0_g1_i1.p1  ORF type:complete len:155 (+),score=14.34 TRINITY_DN3891_c0_g1_i1:37-501(+)
MQRLKNATIRSITEWEDPVVTSGCIGLVVVIYAAAVLIEVSMLNLFAVCVQVAILGVPILRMAKIDLGLGSPSALPLTARVHQALRSGRPHLRDFIERAYISLSWAVPRFSLKVTACLVALAVLTAYLTSGDFFMLLFLTAGFKPLVATKLKKQ